MVGKGFDNPAVQEKIKAIVVERYGVTNVSRVSAVREKISTALVGRCGRVDSDETCRKKSNASKAMWAKPGQRSKIAMAIGDATRRPEIRAQRSAQMAHQMSNPAFRERAFANHKNRLTKLHVRLREQLGLEALGFVSEQRIGRYFVDELHRGSRVVVEVFGDHPHANPKRFGPNDVVRMPGQSYAASKKWALDAARIKMIESMGYRVIVCWESDDIEHVKREIVNVVRSDPT
jgi:very-short-patch-repair endonuclease